MISLDLLINIIRASSSRELTDEEVEQIAYELKQEQVCKLLQVLNMQNKETEKDK